MAHRPDFPGKTDFAEYHRICCEWLVQRSRNECRGNREVCRCFADPETASYIEVHVATDQGYAATRLKNGKYHRKTTGVPAYYCPAWCTEGRRSDERLYFDQNGARPLYPREDGGTSNIFPSFCKEQGRRIFHLHHAGIGHLEDADLVCRSETVLDRP